MAISLPVPSHTKKDDAPNITPKRPDFSETFMVRVPTLDRIPRPESWQSQQDGSSPAELR